MFLSFIVPLYNEEKRIVRSLQEILVFQKELPCQNEWIFVDDGSFDSTERLAREVLGGTPYQWIRFPSNQGKGRAVQKGMLEARGDYLFFIDADLSILPAEYILLLTELQKGYDVAIGSRALQDSRVLVHQSWLREKMGKIFNLIARAFTFKEIRDSQCGFKAFRREVAHELFSLQKIKGFSFDAEILYLAQKKGYRIAEVPVTWKNFPYSRVHILKDSIRMFIDVIRIPWIHRLKPRPPRLINPLLAAVAVCLALALGEATLRSFGSETPKPLPAPKENWVLVPERVWTEPHPLLGWYHQKNKKAVLKEKDFEVEIHTNSQGFRGVREYAPEKPPGTLRALVLGDSFSFGWGVRDEEVWTARLEAESGHLEMINLSVPGYGLDQMLVAFRTLGKGWEADRVFISVFPEDFWRSTRSFADTGHAKPYFSLSGKGELILHNVPVPPPRTLRSGQFPSLIEQGPLERILGQSILYRRLKRPLLKLGSDLGWVDPSLTEEWTIGQAILSELFREIRANRARPVLVIVPSETWANEKRVDTLRKSMLRLGQREGVDTIDLTPSFHQAIKSSSLGKYYFEGDHHWTPEGHRLAAELIRDYLEKRP